MSLNPAAPTAGGDPADFIRANLDLVPVPGLDDIRMYRAQPSSGLWRLAEQQAGGFGAPYWAYQWAGGQALARYFLEQPETVAGKRVFDLGAGGGIVSLAALRAGAAQVTAAEIDPVAVQALRLNAAVNGAAIDIVESDVTGGPAPEADVLAVGDLFYEEETVARMLPFVDRCLARGVTVLFGDPGRRYLPRARLRLVAEYDVNDVGRQSETGAVYAFEAA